MGTVCSMFSDCFKKRELEKPILNIDEIYEDNNGLTRLSDLIDNKYVNWNNYDSKSEQEYLRMMNETMKIRKKYRGNAF
jgi:hypothetical protein